MGVFHSLKQLLEADNPTAVPGVKKLVEQRFAGQWRQRSGDWRLFFSIEHGEVVHEKHAQGILTLRAVRRRDEAY
jgi:mRNA-degrading endonuclease RelE of RelBE toxin-antitoxin system